MTALLLPAMMRVHDSCHPLTDNLFALKSHCVKKHSMVSSEFDKALGVPEDLDYFP